MKILITGYKGFVGRSVTKRLDIKGVEWEGFDGDIIVREDLQRYNDCDTILHLAGIVRCESNPATIKNMLNVNIQGTLNAIQFAAEGKKRFIFASTYLYGKTPELPIKEDAATSYIDEYSYSKWYNEQSIFAWNKIYGLKSVIFRIFNVYGPEQKSNFLMSDIASQIPLGYLKLRESVSRRDFIYIDDLSDLIVKGALSSTDGVLIVNAGSGKSYSIAEIVNIFFKVLGRSMPVKYEGQQVSIKDTVADINLAKSVFGWYPTTDIEEGIKHYLQVIGK